MVMEAIKGFFGEHRWLSNFGEGGTDWRGIYFPSRENAYQYAKGILGGAKPESDLMQRFHVATDSGAIWTPTEAKKLGRVLPCNERWDLWRYEIMSFVVLMHSNLTPEFRQKLEATGYAHLEESNYWHDTYWGVCQGEMLGKKCKVGPHPPVGENNLGKILMNLRSRTQIYRALNPDTITTE